MPTLSCALKPSLQRRSSVENGCKPVVDLVFCDLARRGLALGGRSPRGSGYIVSWSRRRVGVRVFLSLRLKRLQKGVHPGSGPSPENWPDLSRLGLDFPAAYVGMCRLNFGTRRCAPGRPTGIRLWRPRIGALIRRRIPSPSQPQSPQKLVAILMPFEQGARGPRSLMSSHAGTGRAANQDGFRVQEIAQPTAHSRFQAAFDAAHLRPPDNLPYD